MSPGKRQVFQIHPSTLNELNSQQKIVFFTAFLLKFAFELALSPEKAQQSFEKLGSVEAKLLTNLVKLRLKVRASEHEPRIFPP